MAAIVSCFSNAFGEFGVWAAAERIRSTGIGYLELALRGHNLGGLVIPESAVITVDTPEDEVERFVAFLREKGVGVSGCNVGGANILTTEGVELTARRIAFAQRWFGVNLVVSGAGQPKDAAEREVMIRSLRELGNVAGSLGMTMALETHKGPTQSADAMIQTIEDVAHPAVQINFDTGNIVYYNEGVDPVAELERVKHWVRNVHVKDCRGGFEEWYFPALGDGGAVDFTRLREVLESVGYEGAYSIEIEGIAGEPEPGLEGRTERVRRSADHLRRCGYSLLS